MPPPMANQEMADAEQTPDHHLHLLISYLELFHNDTRDFRIPQLRRALRYVYPLFVFLYALVVVAGVAANGCLLVTIVRRRLYRDPTFYFLANLALAGMLQCLVVLPLTLANLFILNWLFGSFLCYLLPMLQRVPIHVSTLTFLLLAIDRYRHVLNPLGTRVPRLLCALAVWVLAICVVLPFSIYITYFDLGALLGPSLDGVGLCTVNVEDDMEEYLRGLFIVMYAMPLAVTAFLQVRMSGEIKACQQPPSSAIFDVFSAEERSTRGSWAIDGSSGAQLDDDGFDPTKEKRTQKYLVTMAMVFGACICPLEIMMLVKDIVVETHENTGHYDLAYVIVVWVGFLPTCSTPFLAASWMMSEHAKQRLKGYFWLSDKPYPQQRDHGELQTVFVPRFGETNPQEQRRMARD